MPSTCETKDFSSCHIDAEATFNLVFVGNPLTLLKNLPTTVGDDFQIQNAAARHKSNCNGRIGRVVGPKQVHRGGHQTCSQFCAMAAGKRFGR